MYTAPVKKIGIFPVPGAKRAPAAGTHERRRRSRHCSFCGRPEDALESLVVGSRVCICGDCVDVCAGLLEERAKGREKTHAGEGEALSTTVFPCRLCGLPTPAPDLVPLPERGPICRECIEVVCTAAGERTE